MVSAAKFIHISYTFSDDNAANITTTQTPLVFQELDIQILTYAAYYGDHNNQEFELSAGDIVSFRTSAGIDLTKLFFKNQTAGQNVKVVAVGLLK